MSGAVASVTTHLDPSRLVEVDEWLKPFEPFTGASECRRLTLCLDEEER